MKFTPAEWVRATLGAVAIVAVMFVSYWIMWALFAPAPA